MPESVSPPEPTPREMPSCLHHLFEAQAARTPDALAVAFGEWQITYAELNAQANRLAHFLRARGVRPESPVGVCLESAPETVAGLLAVLKAGGAYLPLDPAYPRERLAHMQRDASVEIVLTLNRLKNALPEGLGINPICLDTDGGQWDSFSAKNLDAEVGPDNAAYVIYTSGSTGQPKGVVLTHRGAVNNLRWRQNTFPLTAADRMLQTYSYSFDPSVWAIFWPLMAGATLVLPRPGGIADSGYLVKHLAAQQITVAGFGPAMLQMLLAHPKISACHSLRHVFCGGEAMPPGLPARFYARLPGTLHNAYGPTETTIDAACFTVPRDFSGEEVPIGYPLPSTELLLLDDDLKPVLEGEEGELYVGGISLARGYLCRPELTAERFLTHPTNPTPGARIYRTGDGARRGPQGEFYYRGRRDNQIKLRGYRIELGEIEAALCRDLRVRDVMVALREDHQGEARLTAYLVSEGTAPAPAEMRGLLAESLPAHMIPEAFVFLDALPLTPSGKRDRDALPQLASASEEAPADLPMDPVQRQIAQIWEDLLDKRPIGLRDFFWDIGGHSLLAARMMDQIAAACGHSLPLSVLYETGTVETLAEAMRRRNPAERPPLSALSAGGSRTPFFFLYGFHPLGGFYCCHLARRLNPEQPFYAVHPPGRRRDSKTVKRMAADAMKAVQTIQPMGPYRLGGFCGSALVAYEMARQWKAQGQEVELLALTEAHTIHARFRLGLRRLAGSPGAFLAWQRRLLPAFSALQGLRRRWKERGSLRESRSIHALIDACDRAAGAYCPAPYDGPVTLIRAADDPEQFRGDPVALWQEIAPSLSVRSVPGDHLSCLLGDIGGLAEDFHVLLEDIEAKKSRLAASSGLIPAQTLPDRRQQAVGGFSD